MKKSNIEKGRLYILYITENKSIAEIADIFGVSTRTIFNKLKLFGIETRKVGNKKIEFDNEKLTDCYKNKKMGIKCIAADFECSVKTVYRRLRELGLCERKESYENSFKSFDELKTFLDSIGYKWLDGEEDKFYSAKTVIIVMCNNGHKWKTRINRILSGKRCSRCYFDSKKLSYGFIKSEFEKYGYTLLSKEYIDSNHKLFYKCPKGHIEEMNYNNFRNGRRCPTCFGIKKYTIDFVKEKFASEGYQLLSTKYENVKAKLYTICPNGHKYIVSFNNFLQGSRCSGCAGNKKFTFDYVRNFIEAEGYKLLSRGYKNCDSKLEVECPNGHSYRVGFYAFKSGNRCLECHGTKRHTVEHVRDYIVSFGYKLLSANYSNAHTKLSVECPKGHRYEVTFGNFHNGYRCPKCFGSFSREEKQVAGFVKSLGFNIEENTRNIIPPYELDIYIPEKKLAIEYCGLPWHSEVFGGKERKYHRNKMDLCNQKGIRLITIFGDEYINKREVVESRIKNALGCIDKRVYARKCKIKEVPKEIGISFFNKYHLQGSGVSSIYFGLYYNNDLISCLSLGRPARAHARKGKMAELKRMCTKAGYSIVGGFSRLFSVAVEYCRENGYEELVSYCDMRWAVDEPVYGKLGFELARETKYTPHYVVDNYTRRVRNQSLAIKPEERGSGKSEWELRLEQGYDRIWDCGHRTYICTIPE